MDRLLALICLLVSLAAHADWLSELPAKSQVLSGYSDADSVACRLAELPLMHGEGLWQMTSQGALFVVERTETSDHSLQPHRLRLVMVACPMLHIRPGTVFGHAQPTVQPGVLEASLYTDLGSLRGLILPKRFLLKVDDTRGTMTIEPFKSLIKFNPMALLPYMYRRVITIQSPRPNNLDGAIRQFPPVLDNALGNIYL